MENPSQNEKLDRWCTQNSFDHQIRFVIETSRLSEKRTFLKRASDTLTQAICS